MYDIRNLQGTAVNVQAMVFGNSGGNSATGVAFTRNPSTGDNRYFYGEYLINAQGEDVVAGIRTPQQITVLGSREWAKSQGFTEDVRKAKFPALEESMPKVFKQLEGIRRTLEKHYRDMQDIEFTIEDGKLYMLQTRNGKRTAAAAVRIATDLVKEKLIDEKTAVLRVDPLSLDQLLHPVFVKAAEAKALRLTVGLPASPGAATGRIVFTAQDAEKWAKQNESVILVRHLTSPEDIAGMVAAKGILTASGGMTSPAAVVARGMGKCCVCGAGDVLIDYAKKTMTVGKVVLKEGDWISLNGSTGAVYKDKLDTILPKLTGPFAQIMALSDKYRKLQVRTNADTPHDAAVAVNFGAEGIGLCRTEHMFFDPSRIVSFRRLILVAETVKKLRDEIALAANDADKAKLEDALAKPLAQYNQALAELLPLQRKDFEGIFKALKGRPCTIRFLDPPLHEFLPGHDNPAGQKEMAKTLGVSVEAINRIVNDLHEFNPCSATAGATSASPTPRSRSCRPAPSPRPPPRSRTQRQRS
jgi:pyruvate,orthophosphate dikinase